MPYAKIFTINLNSCDFVILDTSVTKTPSSFLVDSQADISVIKISCLKATSEIDTFDRINIRGVTKDVVSSFGTISIELSIDNCSVTQIFHVVADDFNIPADGIIGRDFIKQHRCNMDYDGMTVSFYYNNRHLFIPMLQGPDQDTIVLPARSEVIRKFNINTSNEPQVIDSQEIHNGIFIARTIVNPSEAYVKVLNTTNEAVMLQNNNLQHENLSNFWVYSINSTKQNENERTGNLLY